MTDDSRPMDLRPGFVAYDGPQPNMATWLQPSPHNLTGLVPSMCDHGARYLVVDADDLTAACIVAGRLADGRVLVTPKPGVSWVRSKYMTANMTCVMEQGQPRPDDLATAGVVRPRPEAHLGLPVRLWVPEVYDPAVHGEPVG